MRLFPGCAFAMALGVLAGCVPYRLVRVDSPPMNALAPPPPGLAQVCVLRPHWIARAVTYAVRDNGLLVGATLGNGYFCYLAEPGPHLVASSIADPGAMQGPVETRYLAVAGGRFFLRQKVTFGGFFAHEWVDDIEARKLLGECDYQVIHSGPATEPLPPAVPVVGAVAATAPLLPQP